MMKIEIRKATENDIHDILDIQYQSWLDTYPNKEFWITKEDIEHKFAQKIRRKDVINSMQKKLLDSKYTFFVWVENQKVVWYLELIDEWEILKIGALYIKKDMRGKWVWKSLMENVLKLFKDKKYIILEVAEYNNGAIYFYEKFGFVLWNEIVKEFTMPLSGKVISCKEMRKIIF